MPTRPQPTKLRMVERVIQGRGFVTISETLNAVDAWLSSLPGTPI